MEGLVVELLQSDPDYIAGYQACATEAASRDGANPCRLVDFG
ncbi:MAG: hypothetical protein WAR81_09900 [Pseudomonadales bacterium]|jgi:hypothetical protein